MVINVRHTPLSNTCQSELAVTCLRVFNTPAEQPLQATPHKGEATGDIVRNILLLSLFVIGMPCNAVDIIDPYGSHSVDPKYAWKFDLSTAFKTVGDETYFSLEVNERLLCNVAEVGLVLWGDDRAGKYIVTKFVAGSYIANADITSYDKVTFSISCAKHTTIHKYKRFELNVSDSKS